MKRKTTEKIKNQKGITLIALVVTIVVLLILAGVSLNLVLRNNGIISKAKEAKNKTEQDKINTETALNTLYDDIVAAENGSSGNGGNSGGTTYTWQKKSFVATYTKDGNESSSNDNFEQVTISRSTFYNSIFYNSCTHQINGIYGNCSCTARG